MRYAAPKFGRRSLGPPSWHATQRGKSTLLATRKFDVHLPRRSRSPRAPRSPAASQSCSAADAWQCRAAPRSRCSRARLFRCVRAASGQSKFSKAEVSTSQPSREGCVEQVRFDRTSQRPCSSATFLECRRVGKAYPWSVGVVSSSDVFGANPLRLIGETLGVPKQSSFSRCGVLSCRRSGRTFQCFRPRAAPRDKSLFLARLASLAALFLRSELPGHGPGHYFAAGRNEWSQVLGTSKDIPRSCHRSGRFLLWSHTSLRFEVRCARLHLVLWRHCRACRQELPKLLTVRGGGCSSSRAAAPDPNRKTRDES